MARCKECLHYEICAKEGRLVQIDAHTWDEYNQLDDVERFCNNYIADVVPKSEVEEMMIGKANSLYAKFLIDEQEGRGKALMAEHDRELARGIFEEIEKYILENCCVVDDDVDIIWKHITELKKKYTE